MRNKPSFLHQIYNYEGTPYEIGYQRGQRTGELLREKMQKHSFGNPYWKNLWPKPDDYNLSYLKENHPKRFKDWERALEKTPEWFREEVRGNAEGAGVSYDKLIIATSWFPVMFPVKNPEESSSPDLDCNGFVAYGKGTEDGTPLIGGNAETDHESLRHFSVVRVRNKVGNSFVMATKSPMFGASQCGMNEKGVCIFGSGVSIKPELFGEIGYRQVIRRIVLQEANNIDEAIDILKKGPRMGGQHIYLADKKRAVHIEYAGSKIEVIDPESGFDSGSSPYFSTPKTREWCNVVVDETNPKWSYMVSKTRGVFRMERYHELFNMYKPLTIEKMPTIMGDHGGRGTGIIREHLEGACPQGSDFTICAHGRASRGIGGTSGVLGSFHATSYSNISQPAKLTLWIAPGNPCEAGYFPFHPPK